MGRVWLFGDNVSTDDIIPGRRNITTDIKELARYAFEHLNPKFSEDVKPGDLIIAGHNFGCGSSREHAALAIKGSGVNFILAKSYASIFFRNCINNGLYPLRLPEDVDVHDGDFAQIKLEKFELDVKGKKHKLGLLPSFLLNIIKEDGLIPFLNRHGAYEISDSIPP